MNRNKEWSTSSAPNARMYTAVPLLNDVSLSTYLRNELNRIDIDGAFFGPTFPALFFMTYENQVPEPAIEHYTPRIFGFKIHQSSNSLPRFRNVPGTGLLYAVITG